MITFDEGVQVMRHTLQKQGASEEAMSPQLFAQAVAGILNAVAALEDLGWTVEKKGPPPTP